MSSSEWTVPDNRDNGNVIMWQKHVPAGIISATICFEYQDLEMLASSKKYQVSRGRYGIQKIKKLVKIIQFLCGGTYVYVKFNLQQALKGQRGSRGIALPFL